MEWSCSDHILPWCALLCAPTGAGLRGHSGPGAATDQHTCVCSLLWQRGMTRAAPESCRYLYTSSWRADCNRASLTRVHRQTYARLYPILLVKQDGSTIHIRYPEPRRILTVSFLPRNSLGSGPGGPSL